MTDTLRKIAEAATRLQYVAEMKMADGLSLDLIGRCRATFGDLRLILDALQQKDATIERLRAAIEEFVSKYRCRYMTVKGTVSSGAPMRADVAELNSIARAALNPDNTSQEIKGVGRG